MSAHNTEDKPSDAKILEVLTEVKDALATLQRDSSKLQTDVDVLRQCLAGDRIRGIVGVMDVLDSHRIDLYGNPTTRHIGIKERQSSQEQRLGSLEGERSRLLAWAAGVSSAVVVVWGMVKYFILDRVFKG